MWIKTQDSALINSDKVYQFYTDDNKVFAQLEAGERWSDWTLGKYKTTARAKTTLDDIFFALREGKKTFEMPPEEVAI